MRLILAVAILALAALPAAAQNYPTRAIRIIATNTPGSATDTMTRIFADKLGPALGQPIIIENRPGAGGSIGAAVAAQAAPDGHTLVSMTAFAALPSMYKTLPFDPVEDFAGVAQLALTFNALVIAPSKGIRTLQELIAVGKARPGVLNYTSAGVGSFSHLLLERLLVLAGVRAVHVHSRGTAEAVTEVMTGRIDFVFAPQPPILPMLKDGTLIALAQGTVKRSPLLPDLPTTDEAGIPGSTMNAGTGLWVPKKTPRAIINRLNAEINRIAQTGEIRERLYRVGAEPWVMTPEEFDAYTLREIAEMRKMVEAAGIKPN